MSEEIKYAYLKIHPLFASMSEQKINDACSMVKVKTVYRGETFNYGDGDYSKIYLLINGKVKITECDEVDNELIKDILTAPDVFGDLSLDGHPSLDEFAEALTANTVVCVFNVPDFKRLLHENPMMALSYANIVNNKLKKLQRRHSDLVFRDAKSRLIRFIKNWAISDGNRVGDKIVLNNYLTHSDIARVIATSRQSVNTLLNELRDSGMLFYNRKRIELNDPMSWN
jgi:cAMP-binding proteins - catabolite gene activator and regulatory subunit of cAMP-dependent protein kinases